MNEDLLPAISPFVKKKHVIDKDWYIVNDNNNIWHTGDDRMLHDKIQSIGRFDMP